MLLDIPFVADLVQLRDKRQALIDHNLRRENNRCRNFDYIVGNYVFEILNMGRSDSKLLDSRLADRFALNKYMQTVQSLLIVDQELSIVSMCAASVLLTFDDTLPYPIFLLDPYPILLFASILFLASFGGGEE